MRTNQRIGRRSDRDPHRQSIALIQIRSCSVLRFKGSIVRLQSYPHAIRRASICLMTSSCAVRPRFAEKSALATRQNADSAVRLAISGKSGIDFTRLRDQTIKAQGRAEVAFRAFTKHVASHQCGEARQNGQGHLFCTSKFQHASDLSKYRGGRWVKSFDFRASWLVHSIRGANDERRMAAYLGRDDG